MEERYKLYGVLGSPYVAKLRAILRYRRIPFNYIPASFDWAPDFQLVRPELEHVSPKIVPILWFPSAGTSRVSSEESRVGKECVSTSRYGWRRYRKKKSK